MRSLAVTEDGDFCITGAFFGDIDFSGVLLSRPPDTSAMYVACFDRSGSLRWAEGLSGSVFTIGEFVVPSSRLISIGTYSGTLSTAAGDISSTPQAVVIVEHDASGIPVSLRELRGTRNVQAKAAAATSEGQLMIAGHYSGVLTLGTTDLPVADRDHGFVTVLEGTNPLMVDAFEGENVLLEGATLLSDGAVAVCGFFSADLSYRGVPLGASTGGNDGFVSVVEADGTPRWTQTFEDGGDGLCDAVRAVGDEVLTAGQVRDWGDFGDGVVREGDGGNDGFIVRYTRTGVLLWASVIGERVSSVDVASDGRLVICGSFDGTMALGEDVHTSAGDLDAFVAGLSTDGAVLWSHALGGSGTDNCSGVAWAPDESEVVMAGIFGGDVLFGGEPRAAAGPSDVYIHRFAP
jgi:hypothetical protein